jgi:flagellar basal body-associated protein FliL
MSLKAIIIALTFIVTVSGVGYYVFMSHQPTSQLTSQPTKEMSREDKFFSTPPDKMADPTAGKRY